MLQNPANAGQDSWLLGWVRLGPRFPLYHDLKMLDNKSIEKSFARDWLHPWAGDPRRTGPTSPPSYSTKVVIYNS
jgi:hypothetical protein